VATKDASISKIVVQNGTARVAVGDEVKKGDLLVEGIMIGTHTEDRYVHAEADVYGKIVCEKEKKEDFVQNIKIKTGNEEQKNEICINNFKINFNKGVSKFENYDTISANKKIKLFSNFYFPVEIKKVTNIEYKMEQKEYSEEELKNKIETELEEELENEYQISNYEEKNIKKDVIVSAEDEGLRVKIIYELQEEIGTKVN
jgi:similar to stage IV sporulation protein